MRMRFGRLTFRGEGGGEGPRGGGSLSQFYGISAKGKSGHRLNLYFQSM